MSIIAGIVRFDEAPIDDRELNRLAGRFASRAPDGTSILRLARVGFVHGQLTVTPEAEHERQPLADAAAGLVISFDGRLDNRQELIDVLDAPRPAGDAALALRAYARWGDQAPEHLLGDFAFAIWDDPRRRLFCARDPSGVRPLYYREGRGWMAWASELDVLAAGIGVMPPPNEGMVGEYLSGIVTSKRDTVFRDVYRLPPAHLLVAAAGTIQTRCYWQPDPRAAIRYTRDEEYEEHLADVLRSAVSTRLRTSRPAGVMLSGGVDSSSVTGLAAQLCRAAAVPCPSIDAFSISVPGPDDEQPYFDRAIEAANVPAHRVLATAPRPGQFRDEIGRDLDVQTFPHAPTVDPLRAMVRDRGARVLLTGMGGDDWLGSSAMAYADLLRSGRVLALAHRIDRDSREEDFVGWRLAVQSAVWPLVPHAAQQIVRRALRRRRPPPWIDPDFAARIDLADRLARHQSDIAFPSIEQRDIWHEGASGMLVHSLESTARSVSRFGIEHWHPFFDRRIVEFGLAIPPEQRWRDGRHKDLLRRAMRDVLPPSIADRRSNPAADHVYVEAIDAESGAERIGQLASVARGWVRGDVISEVHTRMRALYQSGTPGFATMAWTVWLVLAVDLWLDATNMVQ